MQPAVHAQKTIQPPFTEAPVALRASRDIRRNFSDFSLLDATMAGDGR